MPKSKRQIIYERLEPYAKENLKNIEVQLGDYFGNKRCQHNSRHRVETGECDTVVVALAFLPKSGVNVHFLNRKGSTYVDHTLGYLSQFNTYYLIKEYSLAQLKKLDTEHSGMTKLLDKYKDETFVKVFSGKEIKELELTHELI